MVQLACRIGGLDCRLIQRRLARLHALDDLVITNAFIGNLKLNDGLTAPARAPNPTRQQCAGARAGLVDDIANASSCNRPCSVFEQITVSLNVLRPWAALSSGFAHRGRVCRWQSPSMCPIDHLPGPATRRRARKVHRGQCRVRGASPQSSRGMEMVPGFFQLQRWNGWCIARYF